MQDMGGRNSIFEYGMPMPSAISACGPTKLPRQASQAPETSHSVIDFCRLVAKGTDVDEIKRQLAANAELANARDPGGVPVLLIAVEGERPIITRLLIQYGADPVAQYSSKIAGSEAVTPLGVALGLNRPFITRMLVKSFMHARYFKQNLFLSARELEKDFKEPRDKRSARHALVEIYAKMDVASMVHGIAKDFRAAPSQTLLDLLELASATERMALRTGNNPTYRDQLRSSSVRLQLAAAACLNDIGSLKDGLGRFECDELLRSPFALEATKVALRHKCRTYTTQPEMLSFTAREWRGPLLHQLETYDLVSGAFGNYFVLLLKYIAVYLLNLSLLPLVALLPQLESVLYKYLRARDHDHKWRAVEKKARDFEAAADKRSKSSKSVKPPKLGKAGNRIVFLRRAGNSSAKVQQVAAEEHVTEVQSLGRQISSAGRELAAGVTEMVEGVTDTVVEAITGDDANSSHSRKELGLVALNHRESSLTETLLTANTVFDLYLIRTPSFKLSVRLLADLGFATTVSFANVGQLAVSGREPIATDYAYPILFLAWAIGGLHGQLELIGRTWRDWKEELKCTIRTDVKSMYRSDQFNLIDLTTYVALLVTLLLDQASSTRILMWSVTTCFAWVRLLRALLLTKSVGPLVLMIVLMVQDVFKYLVINVAFLLASTFAIFALFRGHTSSSDSDLAPSQSTNATQSYPTLPALDVPSGQTPWQPDWPPSEDVVEEACLPLLTLDANPFSSWTSLLFAQVNSMVTLENPASCLYLVAPPGQNAFAWAYGFLFVVSTTILMLNMLIAMMAKTFENVWEAAEVNYQFLFRMAVHMQSQSAPEPPPMNVLKVGWTLLYYISSLVEVLLPRKSAARAAMTRCTQFIEQAFDYSHHVNHSDNVSHNLDENDEYVGTEIAGRNTFTNWLQGQEESDLHQAIESYVNAHIDDDASDERWRTKMMRRLARSDQENGEQIKRHVDARIDALNATLHARLDNMERLLRGETPTHGASNAAAPVVDGDLSCTEL